MLKLIIVAALVCPLAARPHGLASAASLRGIARDANGKPVAGAVITLRQTGETAELDSVTGSQGGFAFLRLAPGEYVVSVSSGGRRLTTSTTLRLGNGDSLFVELDLGSGELRMSVQRPDAQQVSVSAGGGEQLSSKQVSDLPLNKRDFTQLLQLAAGTTTDTNGAANFTQQFAVNGQRGTTAVFAIDGVYTTDPELGGATFSNFNVDAIQEIRSQSGVMPAEIGGGAAAYTDVITKSGSDQPHGSVFEFVRNAAFDARNFFDRRTLANPRRIPPFARNEFGLTDGGPVILPGVYDGRHRTYYFAQYQGFRQVLGTTQVLPVPTSAERKGVDTTAIPGDTLFVPVNPSIAAVLARYPLPNDPQGAYGPRTYATSAKVSTVSDQFSVRIDHRLAHDGRFFARFNFDDVTGPITNPDQIAIDPSFATLYFDHERNLGLKYTRTPSSSFVAESSLSLLRTTPIFSAINQTQPALVFADGLYEAFNGPGGTLTGVYGNLLELRQSFAWAHGGHNLKWGAETRINRDTSVFGLDPNGLYTFGGGTAYAQVPIRSQSGFHDIRPGDPLPDTLAAFLTGTPYSFTASVAAPLFPQGNHIGESAEQREAYNFYVEDLWKATPRLSVSYGLRYEVNSRIHEGHNLTSAPRIVGADGEPARFWDPGARQIFLFNPQPPYDMDWGGWGPRLSLEMRGPGQTTFHAGAAITTILPNLFQDNFLTGGVPFVFDPYLTATQGAPVPFVNGVTAFNLPPVYTPDRQLIFKTGRSTDVAANTPIDLLRFEQNLAAQTPGQTPNPLNIFGMSKDFANGYIMTYSAGLEHQFSDIDVTADYIATMGLKLPGVTFPNSYGGAEPQFAPFTIFDASGKAVGGYGPEGIMDSRSHSTFNSLELSASKTSSRAGIGFQASYTLSKSLDDSSVAIAGLNLGPQGTVLQGPPQNPWNPGAERGPSTFDITHILVFNLVQTLPLARLTWLRPLGRKVTDGWQLMNITTLTSGPPFTVFSGVQQTGVGSNGADRPDQIARPALSTSRAVREDYFGRGADNASFFSIPLDVPDGTGPNHGRFGTLGRDSFRGPALHDADVSLIKDTAFGRRGTAEAATLELRAEVFNVFNLVNFGLPSNIVRGSGLGLINHTSGPSRQIQFSLKLLY